MRGISSGWIPNVGGVPRGGVHGPLAHNVFAGEGPDRIGLGRDACPELPKVGNITASVADFADDSILPAFSHAAAQHGLDRAAKHYRDNSQTPKSKKTVVPIYDPTGQIQYCEGAKHYTRLDAEGRFEFLMNGEPLSFVDSFKYLGVLFSKTGEFAPAVERVVGIGVGRVWAVLAKIRSLFSLPLSFAVMLFKAIVQGAQSYGAEVWLPLAQPASLDATFITFAQSLLHLHKKGARRNIYLLTNTTPFTLWARKLAVGFLLRGVAAPCDTLLHQCVVQLHRWHRAGHSNWLTTVIRWL